MNVRALLDPVRRLWPQKVRTRLTLIYAALFFAAGSALLGLTYGLVASSLSARPAAAAATSTQELSTLIHECKPESYTVKGKHLVAIPPPFLPACKQAKAAYYAGTAAGLQEQRQSAIRLRDVAARVTYWSRTGRRDLRKAGVMTGYHTRWVRPQTEPERP